MTGCWFCGEVATASNAGNQANGGFGSQIKLRQRLYDVERPHGDGDHRAERIDTVDAGVGDLVLTAAGSSARQTNITKDRPVDSVIMAILDSLEVGGEITYRKS